MNLLRLMQHRASDGTRSVIAGDGQSSHLVSGVSSTREIAQRAIEAGVGLAEMVARCGLGPDLDPAAELAAGRILAPIDHDDPAHLMMSGTGLTHLGSADARDRMHRLAESEKQTDSMRIFLEGVEGGKPAAGTVGCQPEWFYKGDGSQVVGPGDPLVMPDFALDGGEEPELAGVYLTALDGVPFRLGLCLANEFSDHVTERHNYLWLAHSKLRQAALGAELLVGPPPEHVEGWHHFKYAQFRRPGDVHVHFLGTATLSFSDGFGAEASDEFEIEARPFTLPLRNRLERAEERQPAGVQVL